MLGPMGFAAPLLSNPEALASPPGAPGSNTWLRTVKTHLVMKRGSQREAAIQFVSENRGTKGPFALTFATNLLTQQLIVSYSAFQHVCECVSHLLTIHEQH